MNARSCQLYVLFENRFSECKNKRANLVPIAYFILLYFSTFMNQLRPELDNILQSLSLNGYSIFSLINDIVPRRNWEDKRNRVLREGLERDTADICACLLSHITSGPERVMKFGKVQCACSIL